MTYCPNWVIEVQLGVVSFRKPRARNVQIERRTRTPVTIVLSNTGSTYILYITIKVDFEIESMIANSS